MSISLVWTGRQENRHIYRDLDIQEFTAVNAQEFLDVLE